jgi:hypothetical protein
VWTGNTRHVNSALFRPTEPNIGSSIGIATDYGLDVGRFDSRQRKHIFLWLWDPSTLLSDGCRGLYTSTLTCLHSVGATLPMKSTVPVFFVTLLKIVERQAMGWTSGFRVPAEVRFFSTPWSSHRLWGPPSLPSDGYRGHFPRGKSGEWWGHHPPASSVEIKNGGAMPPLPIYLHGIVHVNNFTFLCYSKEE